MEFRTRFIIRAKRRLRVAAAFTLAELSVGMGVAALVLVVTVGIFVYSGRNFASLAGYVDMQTRALNAMDRLSSEIRQHKSLLVFSSNSLTFAGPLPVTYTYSASNKTLIRDDTWKKETLLSGCDSLQFRVYQRTPIPGTFEQNEVTAVHEAKVITITWACSRSMGGSKVTDDAQTARIVLRTN